MTVSNSTILIYLGKLNRLELLKILFKEVIIPKAVFEEVVVEGKKDGHIDAFLVEKAINENWVVVKEVSVMRKLEEFGIDKGELEAISLAINLNSSVLLDQTHARIAAKAVGLKPKGTLFVLLLALKKNLISHAAFLDCLKQLGGAGFRMNQELYLEVIKKARQISKVNN